MKRPPKVASFIIKHLTRYHKNHAVSGDFEELFYSIYQSNGYMKAYLWFWMQTLLAVPQYFKSSLFWYASMLSSFFKVAWRNMIKDRAYTALNLGGLSIGIACSLLITLWIADELSYDKFHKDADRIYRVCVEGLIGDNEIYDVWSPSLLAPTLLTDFPVVEQAVRILSNGPTVVRYGDIAFKEEKTFRADSTFFDMFSFKLLEGSREHALVEPKSVVLTASTAKRYFGSDNPIGKVLLLDDQIDFTVTGIAADVPRNSHFYFDMLISMSTFDISKARWLNNGYRTYIRLREGYSPESLEKQLPVFGKKYVEANYTHIFKDGNWWGFFMQPLTDIHLHSNIPGEFEPNGNIEYVYIFSIIALFIILIACINFMNLATARSAGRAREVGMRKVIGSTRFQLIAQHFGESIFLCFTALILGIIFVQLLLPFFNTFVNKSLILPLFDTRFTLPTLIAFGIIVGLISGCYPAMYLSSFQPIAVISGKINKTKSSSMFRNSLVIFQFAISTILITGTIVVGNQLEYFQSKKLGFNKENVVILKLPDGFEKNSELIMNNLVQLPEILSASRTHTVPGRHFNEYAFMLENTDYTTLRICSTEPGYLETAQIKLTTGRFFSEEIPTDTMAIVLNETAVQLYGWDDPIGKTIFSNDNSLHVIGVVEDFHYASLHLQVEPMAFLNLRGDVSPPARFISVRVNSANIEGTIESISKVWESLADGNQFEYFFLDDDYEKLYQSEQMTKEFFRFFSLLAVFIASLGLVGLSAFTAEQRTKEIGIRKTLGASISTIVMLLTKDFVKYILIANIIALPVAYWGMTTWLEGFAYRMEMTSSPFLLSALLTILFATLVVMSQTVRSAYTNPVDALKNE